MNPYFNSLNGWGGGFIAFWPSVVSAPTTRARTFWAGYIPPKRKKKKKEEVIVVDVAVQESVVKYVEVRPQQVSQPIAPIMETVDKLSLLIETQAKHVDIQRKIKEIREEEDIIIILSLLQ